MNIKKTMIAGLLAVSSVFAFPVLQLDISDGIYDPTPSIESTVNRSNVFDLIALLDLTKSSSIENYYISMAITPQISMGESIDMGTFQFADKTIDISQMQFGIPPVDEYEGEKDDAMAPHSIFPTLFCEYGFNFNSGNTAIGYNVQDNTKSLIPDEMGQMLYNKFAVDLTDLNPDYGIHFDVYNKVPSASPKDDSRDFDIGDFAPWSHDADASFITENVPEPATLSLFGMGLLVLSGMGLMRRRK